jgi:hypothetical protein
VSDFSISPVLLGHGKPFFREGRAVPLKLAAIKSVSKITGELCRVGAQSASRSAVAFEIAPVKSNNSAALHSGSGIPVRLLTQMAYNIWTDHLIGGPSSVMGR